MRTSVEISALIADYLRSNVKVSVFIFGTKDPRHKGEYVSVNSLGSDCAYFTDTFANVNIHVPDILEGVANTKRITELSALIIPLINDVMIADLRVYIDSESFMDDSDGTHYQNFKLLVIHSNNSNN